MYLKFGRKSFKMPNKLLIKQTEFQIYGPTLR